ncbi:MAG: ATP-dependent DNA helicase RecG [Acidobacteriota bacterium]
MEVGAGKTIVATVACLITAAAGYQTALMAPTEILAEQHGERLRQVFEPLGVRTGLLIGSLGSSDKGAVRSAAQAGELDLLIGTHALLGDEVRFKKLGLVVIDEQQRFGVAQRLKLSQKGHRPHLLVMTATPIPRSLALVTHGHLDLVEIHDQPAGRGGITTRVAGEKERCSVFRTVRREVEAGHQAFVVCPRVERDDRASIAAARQLRTELAARELAGMRVGLLHGRMPAAEKEKAMALFMSGTTQVLVSTTIIEVGLDAGNATVLVVEQAERFGLSQLHQLRGRVGRSAHPSYCFLMRSARATEEGDRRLEILASTTDGFEIARHDLAFRGPGELWGFRQQGPAGFRLAHLARHGPLLELAQADAGELFEAGISDDLSQAALRRFKARAGPREAG